MNNSSVEETKAETKKIFNLKDEDVEFITEEFLSQDFPEFDPSMQSSDEEKDKGALPDLFHAHNVAFRRTSNGRFYYIFLSGRWSEPIRLGRLAWSLIHLLPVGRS